MGWLHSIPNGKKQSRAELQKNIEMPEVEAGYLIEYWDDLGLVGYAGMGEATLSYLEINAWLHAVGIELEPWEYKAIRGMSLNYIVSKNKAQETECPMPYRTEFYNEGVDDKIGEVFKQYNEALNGRHSKSSNKG